MARFEDSRWADSEFVQEYTETADDVIPNRDQMATIALSLYRYFVVDRRRPKVLDLGCGDGRLTEALLKADETVDVTALDASATMLAGAERRLAGVERVRFVEATFQEVVAKDLLPEPFDCVLSFLSIHHVDTQEKVTLFQYLYDRLTPGGLFVNADPIRPVSPALEAWSLVLWRQWAQIHLVEKRNRQPELIPERLGETLDPLALQMQTLEQVGFQEVECYYKHGMFAMFGGQRPA